MEGEPVFTWGHYYGRWNSRVCGSCRQTKERRSRDQENGDGEPTCAHRGGRGDTAANLEREVNEILRIELRYEDNRVFRPRSTPHFCSLHR